MHILFVADGDSKYGAPNSLLTMVTELKRLEPSMKISVVLTRQSLQVHDFEKVGCMVYRIPYVPYYQTVPYDKWKLPIKYIVRGIQYWYGRIFAEYYLVKKLDIHTVDLIHSNSSREDYGAILAKKYSVPLIWHIREFGDLDYPCYSYRNDYIALMNQTAEKLVAVSHAVMKHWIHKGIYKDKIIQIYNGVMANKEIKEVYPKENDTLKFIMMGSLNETKGQHHVIKAVALLDENVRQKIHIDIVGDGSATYTNTIKHLIEANHLSERIHLLGYQKNFYKNLKNYDCGLMCSRCEGFGRVTAEYMIAGLPVIASGTGANSELVKDGMTGFLYKYNDDFDLSQKITYLVKNANEIKKLGKRAHIIAQDKFSASNNAVEILKEYYKILEG